MKSQLLQQLKSLLEYHISSGIDSYYKSSDVETFLKYQPVIDESVEESSLIKKRDNGASSLLEGEEQKEKVTASIVEIEEEIKNCQSCDLYKQRCIPVPGEGGNHVKLMVVGGWLTIEAEEGGLTKSASIFGKEEDAMLFNMFKAIHLSQEETFVTNLIKCGIGENIQPKAEHIDACVSYLFRQIGVVSPRVILSMGSVATKTLLKLPRSLSQLRGSFHQLEIDSERHVSVMPTYHPSFLLKNPGMKHATWHDLQLVEKYLSGKK